MSARQGFNAFAHGRSWKDKVLEADAIWAQVREIFAAHNMTLPKTPRRPDVRMILENISGCDIQFHNPGNHSASKPELIPATGGKTAVMVMVRGATLQEQHQNAAALYKEYDLGNKGLSPAFIDALTSGKLELQVEEAYGPAPFHAQAEKLVEVDWKLADGTDTVIRPEKGDHAAYGARAATQEQVFLAKFHIFVRGTGTTAELVESSGMNIAVSADWQTGAETTRPIVPSVARVYYGAHVDDIPSAIVRPDGRVKEVALKDGTVLPPAPAKPRKSAAPKPPE